MADAVKFFVLSLEAVLLIILVRIFFFFLTFYFVCGRAD